MFPTMRSISLSSMTLLGMVFAVVIAISIITRWSMVGPRWNLVAFSTGSRNLQTLEALAPPQHLHQNPQIAQMVFLNFG